MSVDSVNAINWEMPNADSRGERSYVVTYRVITTNANDGPITARDATGIPAVNSSFNIGNDFDDGAYATSYSVALEDSVESRKVWQVRVTYTTDPTKRNDENFPNDPVDQPPIISGGGVRFSKIIEDDKDGNPIRNSANDLVTGLEADDDRSSLRIQKNFNTIDLDEYSQFSNSVNSSEFFGLSARKWKLSHPRWEQRFRGSGTPFYTVTFEFESNDDEWTISPYDRGFFYLAANGTKTRFKANNIPQSSPQNLDGNGGALDPALEPVKINGGGIQIYQSRDFGDLNIPTSL